MNEVNDSLLEKLMSCPIKRQLVLEVINSEKNKIESCQPKSNDNSSTQAIKKNICDSPAALLRQRALRQHNGESKDIASPNSNCSGVLTSSCVPNSSSKILEGVIAFVEVKSKDQDRSAGIKALMKNLGSEVRDTFSKDVTHVIFKDGSYTTYQKARLMNVHLVSVLWVEACRLNGTVVAESKFPALGTEAYSHNVSTLCSQLQKDYEEIIREELNKSFTLGRPLPSPKELMIRRKTLTSNTSNKLSQEFPSAYTRKLFREKSYNFERSSFLQKSPEITSDEDSDVVAVIDGNFLTKSKNPIVLESYINETCDTSSNMEFTNVENHHTPEIHCVNNHEISLQTPINHSNITENDSATLANNFYKMKTPKLKENCYPSIDTPKNSLYKRKTKSLSDKVNVHLKQSTPTSSDVGTLSDKILKVSLSPLQLSKSPRISILSKNSSVSSPAIIQIQHPQNNPMNELSNSADISLNIAESGTDKVSAPSKDTKKQQTSALSNATDSLNKNNEKSSSTNMSSLQISAGTSQDLENAKKQTTNESVVRNTVETSSSTNMSSTQQQTSVLSNVTDALNKNIEKSSSTNMSPLQISAGTSLNLENAKKQTTNESLVRNTVETSSSTNMSSLKITSEVDTDKTDTVFNKNQLSVPLDKNIVMKSGSADISPLCNSATSLNVNLENNSANVSVLTKNPVEKSNSINISALRNSRNAENIKKQLSNVDSSYSNIEKSGSDMTENISDEISAEILKSCNNSNENNLSFELYDSFSPLKPIILNDIFDTLDSPAKRATNVTTRRKMNKKKCKQTDLDDPSPKKITRKDNLDDRATKNKDIAIVDLEKNRISKERTKEDEICDSHNKERGIKNVDLGDSGQKERTKKHKLSDKVDKELRVFLKKLEQGHSSKNRMLHETNKPHFGLQEKTNSSNNDEQIESISDNLTSNHILEKPGTYVEGEKSSNSNYHELVGSCTNVSPNRPSNRIEKKKRIRKLYNPDESILGRTVDDTIERDTRRIQTKTTKTPDIKTKSKLILTEKTKEFLRSNNICIEFVLNKDIEVDTGNIPATLNKKRNENGTIGVNNEDRDEQKELAQIILKELDVRNKKNVEKNYIEIPIVDKDDVSRRQSKRLSQKSVIKPCKSKSPQTLIKRKGVSQTTGKIAKKKLPQKFMLNSSSQPNLNVSLTPRNRRSTMEFQSITEINMKQKLKIDKAKKSSIVCTKLHKDEVMIFNQIVKKLGGFFIEDEVSDKTTHLVAGEPKRTINMLKAIATGCWILKHEWLLKSLEAGKWLPEEDFEEDNFSRAIQECRLQRQAFGTFSMDIFKNCGQFYVARGSVPRCSDLRELITLCKGKVTFMLRNATIVIGSFVQREQVICLHETWILDSIQNNKRLKFEKYIIKEDNNVVL